MLNKQVLRVEKPTNQAFRTQVYELNTPFLLTTSVPSTTQTALKPLPSKGNTYPARHIPSFEELWSTVFYPPVSSHIPSFRRGLGRLFCQFLSFLLFNLRPFTLQKTPFCIVKGHLLQCKRACFATQKGVFYNPIRNPLIIQWLQTQKSTIIHLNQNK